MHRVADALERYAPPEIEIVRKPELAALQVLHVIGTNSVEQQVAPHQAIIQYCYRTAGGDRAFWMKQWKQARAVWSYYALAFDSPRFFHAPLGVDGELFRDSVRVRDIGILSSGYVSHPAAEAIEEVARAAALVGLTTAHVGPENVIEHPPEGWEAYSEIDDSTLVGLYGRARWVSGLRQVEGFELPVIEGLACGARPIVFDRPEMRMWYSGLASFVPQASGELLIEALTDVLREVPRSVSSKEREHVLEEFSWQSIVSRFWRVVLS